VIAQVTRRWPAIDPLLPAPGAPPPGCAAGLIVAETGGQQTAIGTCEHWAGGPESLDLAWSAARRFQLTAQVAGPDVTSALDQLLSLWRAHLAGEPGADGEDTAAVVTWPSRDIDGVAALLRHGFAPMAVAAARATGRPPAGPAGNQPPRTNGVTGDTGRAAGMARHDLRIRRAGPADIDAVVRLGLEVVRYDAHFSGTIERPGTADALRREATGTLAQPEAWAWLAERGGTPIGMLYAERPEAAGWIAPMVRLAPVAYLMLMVVLPDERGRGTGAALVAQFHRALDEPAVPVTLLHYEQVNPLSAPFWSQQGYRPLWTSWEVRPAAAIR
jgi:GNAT superfamily N-acetyltransferase